MYLTEWSCRLSSYQPEVWGGLLQRSIQFPASLLFCNNGETFRGNCLGQTWSAKACVGRLVGQLVLLVLLLRCQENWCVLLNLFVLLHQHFLHKNVSLVHYIYIYMFELVSLIFFRKWLYVFIAVLWDEGDYNESFIFTDEHVNGVVESNIV